MTTEIRLLVVSQPCFRAINRAVFRSIAELGPAVHIAAPTHYQFGERRIEAETQPDDSYEISFLEPVGTHFRLQRLRGLRAVARAFKPTHVFVDSDPGSLLVLQAAMTAPRSRICAITAENLPPRSAGAFASSLRRGNIREALNVVTKVALRTAGRLALDRVFTLSEDGTKVVRDLGFSATKIPLGFDPALFFIQPEDKRTATRKRLRLTEPTIAYFGRQTPEKGVHVLLDALAKLPDLPWHLLLDSFAEDIAYADTLSQQIDRLGLRDRVFFFESSHEDMPDFMNAADLVVLPSISTTKWKEQYGRVIQEAMACGRVMVASDSGAISETMDGHGHLVPEANAIALANKLRELLGKGEFVDHAAAESAFQNRSISRQAEIIFDYLQESAAPKS